MTDNNEPTQQDSAPQAAVPVSVDLKRRMRELLSIPDSQRSDEQWDELIEIEIQLAPGNRVGSIAPRQNDPRSQAQRGAGGGAGGGGNWKRHGPGRKGKPGGGGGQQSGSGGVQGTGGGKKPPPTNPVA